MGTIATGTQTRQKDCYASSERVKLTLLTNAEEKTSIVTPQETIVPAGITAPTVAPSGSVGGGGSLSGYYVYAYVYASSKYPGVDNAVTTANGQLWPRSNPSPISAVQDASAGSKTITVTLTKTTQIGIDKILLYRTTTSTTSADASAKAAAGQFFYVATVANNGIAGTAVISDTGLTDTEETLEYDNFVAPTAEFCVFDGTYWWASGNCSFDADATLDGTSTVTVSSAYSLFDGRNAQFVTFDGVSTGGFDGVGTFYAKITATNTVVLYSDAALTAPLAVNFTGTTTIHIRGLANILWRSKPFNPFSWGFTALQASGDSTISVPQTFNLNLGGGSVTAMIVAPSVKRLIIHFENPQQTIALDLTFAAESNFGLTQQVLDSTSSVTAHFTLFQGMIGDKPVILGYDSYNGDILACDGNSQQAIADEFGAFLQSLPKPDRAEKFFHGYYDAGTQLNCFHLRLYETDERNNIMVWIHGPTQFCGWTPDFDVLCSCLVLDSETSERIIMGGTTLGFAGQILAPDKYFNWAFGFGYATIESFDSFRLQAILSGGGVFSSITQTSPSTGVFRISPPASLNHQIAFALGQSLVFNYSADNSFVETAVVTSISEISTGLFEVTLGSPYTSSGSTIFAAEHPKYYGRTWITVTDQSVDDGQTTNLWFYKGTFNSYIGDVELFDSDYSFEFGSEDLDDGVFPDTGVDGLTYAYLGGIPTAFRCYFDLTKPTLPKRVDEVWLTGNQFPTSSPEGTVFTIPACRYYIQYSDDWNDSIPVIQDENIDTTPSIVFSNNTQVPSFEPKSFGFEFIECGQNNYVFYNYTLKTNLTAP